MPIALPLQAVACELAPNQAEVTHRFSVPFTATCLMVRAGARARQAAGKLILLQAALVDFCDAQVQGLFVLD